MTVAGFLGAPQHTQALTVASISAAARSRQQFVDDPIARDGFVTVPWRPTAAGNGRTMFGFLTEARPMDTEGASTFERTEADPDLVVPACSRSGRAVATADSKLPKPSIG